MKITLYTNADHHVHSEILDFSMKVNYYWKQAQIDIIEQGILSILPNRVILNNLKASKESSNRKYPTLVQLGRKKRNMVKYDSCQNKYVVS